ncbi:unnamed protein product [Cyclocybe aegerita]|uniref:Uncharacterized protein n=1 Tax=Cyclocybe aegerita TaxID=1973307 RepID=A0A8S0WJT3_CYCAE|nr:unnamed protein product [Cyclocybe aegerita]
MDVEMAPPDSFPTDNAMAPSHRAASHDDVPLNNVQQLPTPASTQATAVGFGAPQMSFQPTQTTAAPFYLSQATQDTTNDVEDVEMTPPDANQERSTSTQTLKKPRGRKKKATSHEGGAAGEWSGTPKKDKGKGRAKEVERSPSPEKITDESVLRQMPSQIPEFVPGSSKKPICIIKSDIKKLCRLDKDRIEHLKPYEIVDSKTEFDENGNPRPVHLYEERKIEFLAWKVHGGDERFLRYLLKLKRRHAKNKSEEADLKL